jgi:ribonuclease HII
LKTPGPDLTFEKNLWQAGVSTIAGIDEAGRGALAGPVAAAAVVLPADDNISRILDGVRDSKQMTPSQRSCWGAQIKKWAVTWGVGFASVEEIDQMGILPATHLAAERALEKLCSAPTHLILDYLFLTECALPQTSLVKGDQRSLSVAAASVLAKTTRDAFMVALNAQVPGYGFDRHKGYGTAAHCAALQKLGFSSVHRRTFHLHRGVEHV